MHKILKLYDMLRSVDKAIEYEEQSRYPSQNRIQRLVEWKEKIQKELEK